MLRYSAYVRFLRNSLLHAIQEKSSTWGCLPGTFTYSYLS